MTRTTTAPEKPQRLLCWTVCAYRKPGMSEEDYHKHMSIDHPALVAEMMVRYNFVQYTMACVPMPPAGGNHPKPRPL